MLDPLAVFAVAPAQCRGALLQRTQCLGACNGDHRLLGERLHQCHFVVVEAPGFSAPEGDAAHHAPVAQQRHAQQGARAEHLHVPAGALAVLGVRLEVPDLHDAAAQQDPAVHGAR